MTITRIVTELDADDTQSINFVKNLIVADGGTAKVVEEADGTIAVVGTFPKPSPDLRLPPSGTDADRWMDIARAEVGQKEVAGGGNNPRIEEYHSAAGGSEPDSVPWCSSFVNWVMKEAGIDRTKRKNARSWATWGRGINTFQPGCVVVLSRGSNPALGHVGFYVGHENGLIRLLGGNQSDAVNIASYDPARLVARRMPS